MEKIDARATAEDLLMMPPASWDRIIENWKTGGPGFDWFPPVETRPQLSEVVDALDAHIQKAARLRAYLNQRYGNGCGDQGHESAVKASSRFVTTIRRALGYTYPDDNLRF